MRYPDPVIVHKSEYGYDVHCPLFPGCHSQGDTVEEALENIKDAILTYLKMIFSFFRSYCHSVIESRVQSHSARQTYRHVRRNPPHHHKRINPYTLKGIIKDAGLTDEKFKELI